MAGPPGCVLITGCSSGIGLEAVVAFGQRGDTVVAGVRREASLATVADGCAGLKVEPVILDVTDPASVASVVETALAQHSTIDVLVNNAGIGAIGSFEEADEAIYRQIFETNVFGTIAMMKAVLPSMRAAGGGTIVNVGSIIGRVAVPFQSYYSAAKHAVGALTDAIRYETSGFGIQMRVVEPGRIPTAFASNLISERAPDSSPYRSMAQEWEAGWSAIPGRQHLAEAAEVARVIVEATAPDAPCHIQAGDDSKLLIASREELGPDGFETYLREATNFGI
ncbi:MAG: SDR family oxidoreductase [Actinomycetia bacterium]|nr:SDR family oxidoreductase [Actinomycetes bacterium]MCP4228167.1 SDR family oxidoreductase [Actinomycetes bacterium]MCP5031090.1 SDR family oxidoreductase [Actinomycetes bacterium]